MGRPLNKKYFGDPALPGSQFAVTYWDGASAAAGFIVKQKGARRFQCTGGVADAVCRLTLDAVTMEGQMNLTMDGQLVKKISGRVATLADDSRYAWTADDVEAPPAPPAAVSITALVNGTEYTITTEGIGSNWTLIGATTGTVGETFTKNAVVGEGTGTATPTGTRSAPNPPKKTVVEKVTEAVKDLVQDKPPEPKVEEPKKTYKPRAKKAPVKRTTRAKTTSNAKSDSEE